MENKLLSLLINNDIQSAAELFMSLSNDDLTNELQNITQYLIETKNDDIIDNVIKMTEVDTADEINVILKVLFDFCAALINAYIDDEETYIIKTSILNLYKGLDEPLYKLYKSDENYYRDDIVNWHIEFGRYSFIFNDNIEAIKQWETAKKLCVKYLNIEDNETLLSSLYLIYFNLGLAYKETNDKEKSLYNFLPYLHNLENSKNYSDNDELDLDLAFVYKSIAVVCAEENKDYYLFNALTAYYNFYNKNANNKGVQPVVDNIQEVLDELASYYGSNSDYTHQYVILKLKFDFSTKDLQIDSTNIYTMVHYMSAGYDFCNFLILNQDLFEERRIEMYHEESKTYSEKIKVPLDENKIYDYLLEYYNNVKSLYVKYDDNDISLGFIDTNLLLGKYNYSHKDFQKALIYLSQCEDIIREYLKDEANDVDYLDKLYILLACKRNIYAENGNVNDNFEAIYEAVTEMIEIKTSMLEEDYTDEFLIEDLASAYIDAIDFCKKYNLMAMTEMLSEEYEEFKNDMQ
ncbi:MAG: hypothetical protein LBP67_08190 [Bacteroidales bacterium]|jgi:hypothetical protein|nr:hypothetical protein [Bacteroidales bacterium]